MKFKYRVGFYQQRGQLRGRFYRVITASQTDFTNRREAERAAREMNRRNDIDMDGEEIFAVEEVA